MDHPPACGDFISQGDHIKCALISVKFIITLFFVLALLIWTLTCLFMFIFLSIWRNNKIIDQGFPDPINLLLAFVFDWYLSLSSDSYGVVMHTVIDLKRNDQVIE